MHGFCRQQQFKVVIPHQFLDLGFLFLIIRVAKTDGKSLVFLS